jgi:hypothetical protein
MVRKIKSEVPPARPSRPSERLMALVTPTITSRVIGRASGSASSMPSGRQEPRKQIFSPPAKMTTNAAAA